MADLRKKIDLAADKATHIILASVRHDYPELGPLANYVRLADLEWEEVPREPLERLAKGFVMVDEQIVTEEEFEQLKKRYQFTLEETRVPANVSELRGQPAMPGHAKGRVMLVQKREDVERFEKGRVLVSAMTVPDFVPAMSKAVAFVTDEGGITSHAAIVSRELGTPCVVGTKIATRALRDGDLVEVDASRGIVRVVERAAQ
jgi:phosphoenolpyruvate synthase/pyruvate phosphate dikinase